MILRENEQNGGNLLSGFSGLYDSQKIPRTWTVWVLSQTICFSIQLKQSVRNDGIPQTNFNNKLKMNEQLKVLCSIWKNNQKSVFLRQQKILTDTFFNSSLKENSGHVVSVVAGRSNLNRTVFRGDGFLSSFWLLSIVVNCTRLGSSILKSMLHPSELDFIHKLNGFDCIVLTKLPPYWGQMTSADNNLSLWLKLL